MRTYKCPKITTNTPHPDDMLAALPLKLRINKFAHYHQFSFVKFNLCMEHYIKVGTMVILFKKHQFSYISENTVRRHN